MSGHVTKNWQVEFNDETKLSLHFAMKYFTYINPIYTRTIYKYRFLDKSNALDGVETARPF